MARFGRGFPAAPVKIHAGSVGQALDPLTSSNAATAAMSATVGDTEFLRPQQNILLGVTTTSLRGGTASSQQAAVEAAVGYQPIRRCYGGTSYKTSPYWLTSFLGAVDVNTGTSTSLRTTHISWNPDCNALTTENPSGFNPTFLLQYLAAGRTGSALTNYGTETQANLTWLLSCPVYAQCIWTPWHEADLNQGNTGYNYGSNYAEFQLGFQIVADMVHVMAAAQGSPWQVCLVLAAFAWKGSSGSSEQPSNFYTSPQYVDIVGIDAYSEGSVDGSNWDSMQVALGYPADSNEAANYQTRYGGTNGYRTSDASGSWSNGFLGWCEFRGIQQWMIAETGTIRNINGLSPTWVGGGVGNTDQWIAAGWAFIQSYQSNPSFNANCVAVQYFMRGRVYTGSNYLTTAVHLLSDGSQQQCVGANTFATLPTSGNTTGDKRWTTDTNHVYQWSGSAWTDLGAGAVESWELWWNSDGSGWDNSNLDSWNAWSSLGQSTQYPSFQVYAAQAGQIGEFYSITATFTAGAAMSGTLVDIENVVAAFQAQATQTTSLGDTELIATTLAAHASQTTTLLDTEAITGSNAALGHMTGTLVDTENVSSTQAANAALTGTLGDTENITTAQAATAALNGTLADGAVDSISTTQSASASLTGTLADTELPTAALAAKAALSGTLVDTESVAGVNAAFAALVATLVDTETVTSGQSATATLTGSLLDTEPVTGAFAGHASLTGALSDTENLTGVFAASAAQSSTLTRTAFVTAALVAQAALSGAMTDAHSITAANAAWAVLNAMVSGFNPSPPNITIDVTSAPPLVFAVASAPELAISVTS